MKSLKFKFINVLIKIFQSLYNITKTTIYVLLNFNSKIKEF